MGDRGNIVVRHGAEQVWFYTHWAGSEIADVVKRSLAKKWRWNDFPYLARIIFCEMVKGYESDETGFGISGSMGDNGHDIIVVDVGAQSVGFIKENALKDGRVPEKFKCKTPFEAFINATEAAPA